MSRRLRPLAIVLGAVALFGLAIVGCESADDPGKTSEKMEERVREIETRMKESMPKTQQIALAQKVDPAVVKKAQDQLKTLKEYLEDPPSGTIDGVTVNAIEAFQRRVGLRDDGLLDDETLRRLEEAAKSAGTATKTSAG